MLSLVIYETHGQEIQKIKESVKEYANEQYTVIKQIVVNNINDLLKTKARICLIDYDIYLENEQVLTEWRTNNKSYFIFGANDYFQMVDVIRRQKDHFCLLEPVREEVLVLVLDYIRQKIKSNIIAVKIPHSGEEIIEVKQLNYINIVNRNLRFYLKDKTTIDSQSLRQSFAKEIEPMLKHPELFFIAPSMVVNMENIKQLFADHMVFNNGDCAYYPRTAHEKLQMAWKEYHEI